MILMCLNFISNFYCCRYYFYAVFPGFELHIKFLLLQIAGGKICESCLNFISNFYCCRQKKMIEKELGLNFISNFYCCRYKAGCLLLAGLNFISNFYCCRFSTCRRCLFCLNFISNFYCCRFVLKSIIFMFELHIKFLLLQMNLEQVR